jgi:cytoskeleton protein RodZ
VLRFEKESWVEIKARNGTLLSQLNPAGSEKTVEGDPPFQLTIGNAPSVQVTYNDQPVDLKPHFKVDVARFTLQ